MSVYGARVSNPTTGVLVLSSEASGLYCIGRASLLGSVVQASGLVTSPNPGRIAGHSTYRIAHAGPIIAAVDLPANRRVGINSVTQSSPGVWDIEVYSGSQATDAEGFSTQSEVAVWAYGLVSAAPSGWGGVIRRADGSIAYDLTRANPLFPRASVMLGPGYGSDTTILVLTRPVMLGTPTSYSINDILSGGANTRAVVTTRETWLRDGTTLFLVSSTRQQYRYFSPSAIVGDDNEVTVATGFLIEGAGLP